jgi:heptosyltransferase-3
MSLSGLPPPEAVRQILIWHQGGLGDLLLAGPALAAVRRRYPGARLTGLGHPERWGLLSRTLSMEAVWDSRAADWAPLFSDSPLPGRVRQRLAPFDLALVFSPRPQGGLLHKLGETGVPGVFWVPSFPESGREAVAALQARHLAALGLGYSPRPLQLAGVNAGEMPDLPGPGPWLAMAPGSGQPLKNWPLTHYYEVSRALAWDHQLRVVWLTGPAEAAILPYIEGLAAAQGQMVLAGQPLARVAAVLSGCRLYLGNDSGLTHLAAAAGARGVLGLFGPTDPQVWAPPGERVRILAGPCPLAPCAAGREIPCPASQCLQDLSPEKVRAAAAALLAGE